MGIHTGWETQSILGHHAHTFTYPPPEPGGNTQGHRENMPNSTQRVTWAQDQTTDPGTLPVEPDYAWNNKENIPVRVLNTLYMTHTNKTNTFFKQRKMNGHQWFGPGPDSGSLFLQPAFNSAFHLQCNDVLGTNFWCQELQHTKQCDLTWCQASLISRRLP